MNFEKSFALLGLAMLLASGSATCAQNHDNSHSRGSTSSQQSKVEAFALVGTGSYAKGALAIFDGNDLEFKTMVHLGEQIGGCTLVSVKFDSVRLQVDGDEVELTMDKQLRRENQGSWQVAELREPFTKREYPVVEEKPAGVTRSTTLTLESPEVVAMMSKMSDKEVYSLKKDVADEIRHGKDPTREITKRLERYKQASQGR